MEKACRRQIIAMHSFHMMTFTCGFENYHVLVVLHARTLTIESVFLLLNLPVVLILMYVESGAIILF